MKFIKLIRRKFLARVPKLLIMTVTGAVLVFPVISLSKFYCFICTLKG